MTKDARSREANELRRRSQDMAFAAPHSAAVVSKLADALNDDASLNDLLGSAWLDRPLAGVRLLAGVHDLVLAGKAPEFEAVVYHSDPDAEPVAGDVLWKLFRQVIFDHPTEMRTALDWPVQQHVPGRAAFLLAGLAMTARPRVRLLELGACAGLILQLDKYLSHGSGWSWGSSNSPVSLQIDSPAPSPGLTIVEGRGCDLAPVDPRDPIMVRRLHAFIPPELGAIHQNLDTALKIAADSPPPVDQAGAQEWLERQLLDEPAPGVHTVIWHSQVWHLLGQAEQAGIRDALFAAARRFPLTRIGYEPDVPGGPATLVVESFQ
jgi:hypothetical protein